MLKFFFILTILIFESSCFVPSKILSYLVNGADSKLSIDLGYQSETIVHEEIIKRGILRSVVRYFYNQPNGNKKINLTKIDTDYLNVRNIYYDYYGKWLCDIDLEDLIDDDFEPQVASVDFDPDTRDLPSAHFDAEQFIASNKRVMNYITIIDSLLQVKDYKNARKFSGKILHTIHDFYSHSNWVEMGNRNKINSDIGTEKFNQYPISNKEQDPDTCVSNCELVQIECKPFFNALTSLIKAIGIRSSVISCPIKYYKCKDNLVLLNKLVSGYYVGQDEVKPDGKMKCSHGGIMDGDSFKPAQGGINKDSGYYMFSPHADLHLDAANLAVNHTEYFFENLRSKFGDDEFSTFLKLGLRNSFLNQINNYLNICSISNNITSSFLLIFILLNLNLVLNYFIL